MKKLILLAVITISACSLKAQYTDYLLLNSESKLHCKIEKITSDSVQYSVKSGGQARSTKSPLVGITEIYIHKLRIMQDSVPVNSVVFLSLKNGETFFGSIDQYEETGLQFTDFCIGKLNIRGELVENFTIEQPGKHYLITTINDKKLNVKLLRRENNIAIYESDDIGEIAIVSSSIKSIHEISQAQSGRTSIKFENPNSTRYLFTPSAYNLRKREGYFQNTYILGNSVNYGVTDNFSMGALVVLPVAAILTPKLGFKITENAQIGFGAMLGVIAGDTESGNTGALGYGLLTIGSRENNFTIGTGYGYLFDEVFERPIINFSGMLRASNRIALVTENWLLPIKEFDNNTGKETDKYYGVYSYGMRFMWEKVTIDLAFLNNPTFFEFVPVGIPYIDFVYKF